MKFHCNQPLILSLFGRRVSIASLLAAAVFVSCGCQMAANSKNAVGTQSYLQGNYQAAIYNFQQALANDPNNADARYNLAATYHQIGKQTSNPAFRQQAELLYNQCLQVNPNHVDGHRGLAVLLAENNQSDKAFELMQNWVRTSPSSSDAHVELARLYQEFGDKETARRTLENAVVVNPMNQRGWTALGKLRDDAGDFAGALASYQRSYQLNPQQPAVAQRIAAIGGAYGMPGGTTAPYNPAAAPNPYAAPYSPATVPGNTPRLASPPPAFPLR